MSRYSDLTGLVPKGSFYDADGHILPRLDDPYEFLFATDAPDTKFGVFVDNQFIGEVTSADIGDPNLNAGDVIVRVILLPGRHTIVIENDLTGRRFTAYATIRNWATWHAAYAEVLEGTDTFLGVDAASDSVESARALELVDSRHADNAFGRMLRQPNDVQFSHDTYRHALRRLRHAFRQVPGKYEGLRQVVNTYTSSNPFLIPRAWRPQWYLGSQLAPNADLQARARDIPPDLALAPLGVRTWLYGLNLRSTDWVAAMFNSTATSVTIANQPPVPQKLMVTFTPFNGGSAWSAGTVTVYGTAPGGAAVSEEFNPADQTLDLDGDAFPDTVPGTQVFETVTAVVNNTPGGVGQASVGVMTSRFIDIVGFTGASALGSHDINYSQISAVDYLVWVPSYPVSPSERYNRVAIPSSGRYTLPGIKSAAAWTGLALSPFVIDTTNDQLWLEHGDRGILRVPLTNGGAVTAATIVSDINSAIAADVRYGASSGFAAALVSDSGQTAVQLYAGDTTAGSYQADGRLRIHRGWFDGASTVLGLPRRSAVQSPVSAGSFDTSITYSTPDTDFAAVQMSADSPVRLRIGRGVFFTSGSAATFAAAPAMSAAFAEFTSSVFDSGVNELMPLWEYVHANTFAANLTTAPGPITFDVAANTPPSPQVVAVFYEAGWDGPPLTVTGIDSTTGVAASETFTPSGGFSATNQTVVTGVVKWASISSITKASGGTAPFTAAVGLPYKPHLGGSIRSTAGINVGLHEIVAVYGTNRCLLRHQNASTGGTFTFGATTAWRIYTNGEIVTGVAHNTATGTITLQSPGLVNPCFGNTRIELEDELPFVESAREADGEVIVDVDLDFLPASTTTDTIAITGTGVPDSWRIENATSSLPTFDAMFGRTALRLVRGGSDITFTAAIERAVPDYLGMQLRCTFWVQQHDNLTGTQDFRVRASWDGGASYTTYSTTAVPGTIMTTGTDFYHAVNPTAVSAVILVPYDAESMHLRLEHVGSASGNRITIERVSVTSETHTGLSVGDNTIVRTPHRTYYGQMLYWWSAEVLDPSSTLYSPTAQAALANLNASAGLTVYPDILPDEPGQIDFVMPAHTLTERVDMTQYSGATALNVKGAYTDSEWALATLTNMERFIAVPGRLTEVIPTRTSRIEGELLAPDGFGVATLAQPTTQSGPFPENPNGRARLYKNGIAMPDTENYLAVQPWEFTANAVIDIDASEFSPAAVYTIDYDVLIRAETAIQDLGTNAADFVWLVDAPVYRRRPQTTTQRSDRQQLSFNGLLRATLALASDQDTNNTTVFRDDGTSITTVSELDWRYVDNRTVEIVPRAFDEDSIYSIEYVQLDNIYDPVAQYVIEGRWAATQAGVSSAVYEVVEPDQVVPAIRYQQYRITISNVTDVRDIRVMGLGVRGIELYGSTPFAPGILLP